MGDLISRQAAIDAVCNNTEDTYYALEHLPSAEPGWIPVSERLPEIKEHHVSDVCLVYCDNGAMAFSEMQENIFGQVGWDVEREDDYHEPIGEVVAWMPLPNPYQEGNK